MQPKSNKIIIVHGFNATHKDNWFPWFKRKLEEEGREIFVPDLPNPGNPIMQEWLDKLNEVIGVADENLYLIGHSLGVITILRYLEALPYSIKVGGAVLVAGFSEPISLNTPLFASFFQTPLDYNKVKNSSKQFVVVHADNDSYVPFSQTEILRDKLGAELVVVKLGGHLIASSGYLKLPVALNKLNEMIEKRRFSFINLKKLAKRLLK